MAPSPLLRTHGSPLPLPLCSYYWTDADGVTHESGVDYVAHGGDITTTIATPCMLCYWERLE